jgi:hypothetical protein
MRRGHDPGPAVFGHAGVRPGSQRRGEGLLQSFFGAVERAGKPDQGGENSAGLIPE